MTAPDGTEWTVSSRAEPDDDAEDESEADGFWNGPLGWLISLVAIGTFIGVFFLSPPAAAAIAASLALVEVASLVRARDRRWLVEARASAPARDLVWRVAGKRRAARAVTEVAGALERGLAADPEGATRL